MPTVQTGPGYWVEPNPYSDTPDTSVVNIAKFILEIDCMCDTCPNRSLCSSEELACRRFTNWVRTGADTTAPMSPSKKLYAYMNRGV